MIYLDHLDACNGGDFSRFIRFWIAGRAVGWVDRAHLPLLQTFGSLFRIEGEAVHLHPAADSPAGREEALAPVLIHLAGLGLITLRGEDFPVIEHWGSPPLMRLDRGAVSFFGIPAFGLHINGLTWRDGQPYLWIGRRALNRPVAPGKLDNMVAGGQPFGLTLAENLIKEAAEEASVPAALAATARPVGAISYRLATAEGVKEDTMFCFDLALPPDFTPRNADGETSEFYCWSLDEVALRLREDGAFKFNVGLVILDFLIRHGYLHPDQEPDYLAIVGRLRSLRNYG